MRSLESHRWELRTRSSELWSLAFQKHEKSLKQSQKATAVVGETVGLFTLDKRPLSVIRNVGFCSLNKYLGPRQGWQGWTYLWTCFPETVWEHISCKLKELQAVDFMTDIWISNIMSGWYWINTQSADTQSPSVRIWLELVLARKIQFLNFNWRYIWSEKYQPQT